MMSGMKHVLCFFAFIALLGLLAFAIHRGMSFDLETVVGRLRVKL